MPWIWPVGLDSAKCYRVCWDPGQFSQAWRSVGCSFSVSQGSEAGPDESYSSKSTTSPYFALVTARASASTSRRKRSSLGTVRMHSGRTPMIIAARLRALWLWSLMYHVYGRALGVAGRFPRRYQGVDAGRRPPAGQKTSRILRIAEPTPKPVDDDQLELAGTTRDQPGALVDVVSGGHKVGYHPGPGG